MISRRVRRWTIEPNDDGTADLVRDGRRVRVDLTESEIRRYLRRYVRPTDIIRKDIPGGGRKRVSLPTLD